jgi:NDP-4-keto-2,6-dideoxyhexose 3-C-methyltransferase
MTVTTAHSLHPGKYYEVHRCRICGNANLVEILDLGVQALTGIFPRNREENVPVGPLALVKCMDAGGQPSCGLVQLRHSYHGDDLYGANYGYRSGLNSSMVAHLRAKAERIKQVASLSPGDVVLDVGSNDGTFLSAMRGSGLKLIGMDPTGSKFRPFYPPDVRLIPEFFSARSFRTEANVNRARVVTSIAMFYDIEDPLGFMREIEEILADDGVWLFEQSYLPKMLASNSYDTVCHEHLEYYALRQILYMVERAGLKIIDVEVNNVNGGSFSVVAAKQRSEYPAERETIERLLREESDLGLDGGRVFEEFARRVTANREEVRRFLADARDRKVQVFGYGASTKGNVLLQYCGVTPEQMPYIADVNEDKFGAFTPGTKIPIISEQDARKRNPDMYLVLPWHFRDNILAREKEFLAAGHKIVFPLPTLETVSYAQSSHRR